MLDRKKFLETDVGRQLIIGTSGLINKPTSLRIRCFSRDMIDCILTVINQFWLTDFQITETNLYSGIASKDGAEWLIKRDCITGEIVEPKGVVDWDVTEETA